jgi:hypothetical protein
MSQGPHGNLQKKEFPNHYFETTFMVKDFQGRDFQFTVNNSDKYPLLRHKKFAILTAFNPLNTIRSRSENKKRLKALEEELKKREFNFYPSKAAGKKYSEESFTIEDISEKEAIALGKQFIQFAILYCDENGPRFVKAI